MATVAAGDRTLTEDDAADIMEELLSAQNKSYYLGMKLKLPISEIDAIHSQYHQPRDRLLHIILAFLKRAEPRPTWRVIVEALKSSILGLPTLAKKIEAAHFPDSTSTREVVPEPKDTESAANTTATGDDDDDEFKSKPSSQQPTPVPTIDSLAVAALKGEIKSFQGEFNSIIRSTIKQLDRCGFFVAAVINILVQILALNEHKKFLAEKHSTLYACKCHKDLFQYLKLYWNFTSYNVLEQLLKKLAATKYRGYFKIVNQRMEIYKTGITNFMRTTRLVEFCEVASDTLGLSTAKPPAGFIKMVTRHKWPKTVKLSDVEEFRRRFLRSSDLPECAMMVHQILRERFTKIVWFAAVTPSENVNRVLRDLGRKFDLISVEVDGEVVYQSSSPLPVCSYYLHNNWQQERVYTESIDTKKGRTDEEEEQASAKKLRVKCCKKGEALYGVAKGSATTDGRFAYFTTIDSDFIYQYEYSTEMWKTLNESKYRNSGLTIIGKKLTAVGGEDKSGCTNRRQVLPSVNWIPDYPPMVLKRHSPATIVTPDDKFIFVIGGNDGKKWTEYVEVYRVDKSKWYNQTGLPKPLKLPSATVCGDALYVIGSDSDGYSCSLEALPSSITKPIPPESISWTPLPHLPVADSTAATLCGQLVLIGGRRGRFPVKSIHQLVDGQWVEIGSMLKARYDSLVVSLSPNKIIIVGGHGAMSKVEECVAELPCVLV